MIWYICVAMFALMTGHLYIEAGTKLKKTSFHDKETGVGLGAFLLLIFGIVLCIAPALELMNARVLNHPWQARDLLRIIAVVTWSILWTVRMFRADFHIDRMRHAIHLHLGGSSNIC